MRSFARNYARIGDYATSSAMWRRALEKEPDRYVDLLCLAASQLKVGDISASATTVQKAIVHAPLGETRHAALVGMLAQQERAEVASKFRGIKDSMHAVAPNKEGIDVVYRARQTLMQIRKAPLVVAMLETVRPKVSYICPIHRPTDLENAVEQVARQKWANAEVIFALHSSEIDPASVRKAWYPNKPLRILTCASEPSLGAVLNRAIEACTGDIVMKFDADDAYLPNYTSDMLSALTYFSADMVSKKSKYRYFQAENRLDLEFPATVYVKAAVGVEGGGASLCIRRSVFENIRFQESARMAEDTSFVLAVAAKGFHHFFVDPFNHYSNRSGNTESHTWELDNVLLSNYIPRILFGEKSDIQEFVEA